MFAVKSGTGDWRENKSSATNKCSTMEEAEDSPQKPVVIFLTYVRCCNQTALIINHFFREGTQRGVSKSLGVFIGKGSFVR